MDETPAGFELPLLGLRNYWYPVMFSRDLKVKPVAQRLLGDDLVLFRANGQVCVFANRCPHRGTPLSLGKSQDRKSTRLNSSHIQKSRMPSSA